jgi:tetratricopeptide (TPR) repeat protein
LKTILKILSISALLLFLFSGALYSKNLNIAVQVDTNEIRTQYSLFSEYHKNRDYTSALPYGWNVIELDPKMFNKWVYTKMEESLWYLHDSTDISPEEKEVIEDTIIYLYNTAIEHYPEEAAYFQARKSYVSESWLNLDPLDLIAEYEKTIEMNENVDPYYYDRLGTLYRSLADNDPEYKQKALDLYTYLSEREPDNPRWPTVLEGLVDSIDELVDLTKKAWDLDRENPAKAWKFASLAMKADRHQDALPALEFLVQTSPDAINYWNRLAETYQKLEMTAKAEETYKKLIQIEPDNKNHYLNLGILYKEKGQLAAARTQFQKASEVGGGWGLPIYYEGNLYEEAARGCTYDLQAKMVYQLAVDTYRKASSMEPSLTRAQERIRALSGSIPTQEDYFFAGYKSGQTIAISGSCYGWIGRSITVP